MDASDAGPDVAAYNWNERLLLLDDDTILPIDCFVDGEGEETDDPEEAVAAIAQAPDGWWWRVDLSKFAYKAPH